MIKPADMHHHFRQGPLLGLVAPMVRERFASAIVMPNVPLITTAERLESYHVEIIDAMYPHWGPEYKPARPDRVVDLLMTLYLTDTLEPSEIDKILLPQFAGVKFYPPGKKGVELTTNSGAGVTNPASLWTPGTKPYEVLRALADRGKVLLLHAADGFDKNGRELDPYDQEKHFVRETLPRIIEAHPNLKISVEHLSTMWGAEFMMRNGGKNLGCSLTLHHLTKDRRDVFRSGFHPHLHWWPIIQPSEHKEALQELAKSDRSFVWLGTDSAPHPLEKKLGKRTQECCIGGVLTAHIGIEGYVEAFEDMGALDNRFERFASINGPRFYGREPSEERITLVREDWKILQIPQCFVPPEENGTGVEKFIPFRLGETIRWKLAA